jgi:hypothetical protein
MRQPTALNNVTTEKYRIVPKRSIAKPTGIQRSHGCRAAPNFSVIVSSASGMQTNVLRVAAPSIMGASIPAQAAAGPIR